MMSGSMLMVVAALVLSAAPAWERGGGGVEAYRYGDYVQTAWRGQLGEMRTQWQDVVARHCPRFRQNSVAVLTIPRPRDEPEEGLGEYKVSYGVDSERHVTFWLPLIEKTPKLLLPAVRLEMLHAGDDVLGIKGLVFDRGLVRARSGAQGHEELDGGADAKDSGLIEQAANLYNSSSWPKRVLVEYVWVRDAASSTDVDVGFALTAVYLVAFVAVAATAASILFSDAPGASRGRPARVPSTDRAEPPVLPTPALRTLMSDAAVELSGSFSGSLGVDFDLRDDGSGDVSDDDDAYDDHLKRR